MSVFNKAGANLWLLFKVMVSPVAEVILLLGPGWKTDPDKGEGKAGLMGFLIVSQSELPGCNCSRFGVAQHPQWLTEGQAQVEALGFAHFGFFLL